MSNKYTEDISIGIRIAEARNALGLTQEELTARLQVHGCDMPKGSVAKIEVGFRHIKVTELRAFSKVLGVTYEYLID